jgi:hypothetical protein
MSGTKSKSHMEVEAENDAKITKQTPYRKAACACCVLILVAAGLVYHFVFLSSSLSSFEVPFLTPPIKSSCPNALTSDLFLRRRRLAEFNTDNIKERFFNADGGPTNLFDIIADVDNRLQELNDRMPSFEACMQDDPTPYSFNVSGESLTFYAQCSDTLTDGMGSSSGVADSSSFMQWAFYNNTWYLYERVGATIVASQLRVDTSATNPSAPDDDSSSVQNIHVWYSVGIMSRTGSHAVAHVYSNPAADVFEMTAAGVGIGYCGVQFRSSEGLFKATGSADGVGYVCEATDSACTLADNFDETGVCGSMSNFSLPKLGRQAYADGTWEASLYPGGTENTVTLSNSGVDDAFFGPSSPTV